MQIVDLRLLPVSLPLKAPFESAHEALSQRHITLVYLKSAAGNEAVGELEAFDEPGYSDELQVSERAAITDELVPALLAGKSFDQIAGHRMAKAAVELPMWSLEAQAAGVSLADMLAQQADMSVVNTIRVGISLGIAPLDQQLARVQAAVAAGYSRIKLKVAGVVDLETVQAVHAVYPDLHLIVDGNEAFSLADAPALRALEGVDMIEQPLAVGDFAGHAELQAQLDYAVCLDEDILTIADLRRAIQLGSAQAINLKPARVGGFKPALKMLAEAQAHGLTCWVGGMVESDMGRYYSQSLAQLSGLSYPGDVGPTDQFFDQAVTTWQPALVDQRMDLTHRQPPQLTDQLRDRMITQPNLLTDKP